VRNGIHLSSPAAVPKDLFAAAPKIGVSLDYSAPIKGLLDDGKTYLRLHEYLNDEFPDSFNVIDGSETTSLVPATEALYFDYDGSFASTSEAVNAFCTRCTEEVFCGPDLLAAPPFMLDPKMESLDIPSEYLVQREFEELIDDDDDSFKDPGDDGAILKGDFGLVECPFCGADMEISMDAPNEFRLECSDKSCASAILGIIDVVGSSIEEVQKVWNGAFGADDDEDW